MGDAGRSHRPTVVVLEPIHPGGIELLEQVASVRILAGPNDPDLAVALAEADALIVRSTPTDARMMAAAPRLRVIGRHGAGLDNIDLVEAERRGIRVLNTPRSNTESVAEFVITVALMALKRVTEASFELRAGTFTPAAGSLPGQVHRAGLVGREATGARLGLVGAGAIGRAVATRARALGMVVSAYDPFLPAERMIELQLVPVDTLDELLSSSDIVSLHVPGGDQNRSLIGRSEISLMPPGSILVNAARGELVDVEALAEALHSGHLAAAAVDVFDPEPPPADSPLFSAPRLLATPHMAAMTEESLERMSLDVAAGVIEALRESLVG
jgi:D-3-phosphoglycerate dehydrogenase